MMKKFACEKKSKQSMLGLIEFGSPTYMGLFRNLPGRFSELSVSEPSIYEPIYGPALYMGPSQLLGSEQLLRRLLLKAVPESIHLM